MSTMNIRVIYHQSTGNTEKLACAIADTINVVYEPFTCKGQSWVFINRNQPNETDLSKVRKYAKNAAAKVDR